jgi:subtilisin-like proprotein convertase family protein
MDTFAKMIKHLLLLLLGICLLKNNYAQIYSGVGGSIPDNNTPVYFNIPVAGLSSTGLGQSLGIKKVTLNITHTYCGDLVIALISPSGTYVPLISNAGGGGQNFTNTVLDSFAAISINQGTAPFTGSFRPQGNLGSFNNGQNGNGTWQLVITDVGAVDSGTLNSCSIEFAANAPIPFVLTSNIPVVVLSTNGQGINQGNKTTIDCKIINNANAINNVNDAGNEYSGKVAIKIRGKYSSSLPQKPYGFTLVDALGNDTNIALLGMPKEHDWILQATYNDKSFVRNSMMYELFRNMGHYAARSKYVEVVLDNEYQGIYMIMEKIKRDSARVPIAKLTAADTLGDELTGGYIFTHDYQEEGWNGPYSPANCNTRYYGYNLVSPNYNTAPAKQFNYIKSLVTTLEDKLYGPTPNDTLLGYKPLIHLPSFIDYMLANEMAWNGDGYKKSMFFWKDKNSKDSLIHAGPIWDFDWALKRMPWTPTDYSGWYYKLDPCDGDVLFLPWWNIMMQDTTFSNQTKCRYELHRKYAMHLDTLYNFINKQASYLNKAQQRHYDYWQTLGQNTGTPEQNPVANTFTEELDTLKSIIKQRITWIDKNLPGKCYQPLFPTSINTFELIQASLFPNPTFDNITVQASQPISKVQILNMQGCLVKSFAISNVLTTTISLADIPSGVYYCYVYAGLSTKVLKCIVQ